MKIIEYNDKYKNQIIDVLVEVATVEHGFKEWEEELREFKNEHYHKNDGNCWIAINDIDEVMGTISLRKIDSISCEIKNLYVDKKHRNQGVAQALLDKTLEFAKNKNYTRVELGTCDNFGNAIKLYERNGFVMESSFEGAHVYSKMLKDITELKKIEFEKREKRLEKAQKQELIYEPMTNTHLKITYIMTWTGVCGGTKIILEHANRLTNLGHDITLISHDKRPDWFNLNTKVKFIQVHWGETLCEKIPESDIIVATYWREIYECVEQKIAPVIYFEQGDFHLFDTEKLDERVYNYIYKQLHTIDNIYTVSSFAKTKLNEMYNVDAKVIPNAVDEKIFYYEPHSKKENISITVIGSEEAEFKKISNILKAVEIVKEKGYNITLNWITPTKPVNYTEKCIINPEQIVIGNTLRNSDIYICASMYESFCLPVLEAMTCGAAIITTNNGGNMDFVLENENALIIEKDNIDDIVNKIETLINDVELKEKISLNGVKKSRDYSWQKTIKSIDEYYREISNYKVKK